MQHCHASHIVQLTGVSLHEWTTQYCFDYTLRYQLINYVCIADRDQKRVEKECCETEEKKKKVGLNN